MGTRSITRFVDEDKTEIACMYRQYDSYPAGHGKELKEALKDRWLVNGFTDGNKECNGIGCMAAMVVAALKDGCGNIYLTKPGAEPEGYDYTLYPGGSEKQNFGDERALVRSCKPIMLKLQSGDSILYDGKLSEFDPEKAAED